MLKSWVKKITAWQIWGEGVSIAVHCDRRDAEWDIAKKSAGWITEFYPWQFEWEYENDWGTTTEC